MALTTNKGQEKGLKDNELDTCCPFFIRPNYKEESGGIVLIYETEGIVFLL